MFEKSRLIQLFAFALLALISYAIYDKFYGIESGTQYEPFTKGYSLEGVIIKTSDESGFITSTLVSPSMIHYADTEKSVIESPQYTLHQEDGNWVFNSSVGEINKGQTEVYFPESVELFLDVPEPESISIHTSQLNVVINSKTGKTEQRIDIKRPGLLLTGLGSLIDFNDHSIEILEDMYAEFEN